MEMGDEQALCYDDPQLRDPPSGQSAARHSDVGFGQVTVIIASLVDRKIATELAPAILVQEQMTMRHTPRVLTMSLPAHLPPGATDLRDSGQRPTGSCHLPLTRTALDDCYSAIREEEYDAA
jgi:hypothetical protein